MRLFVWSCLIIDGRFGVCFYRSRDGVRMLLVEDSFAGSVV